MKVQGVGSPAEFGDPGDVTTVSKSGTDFTHGDAFWYHQNSALEAVPFGTGCDCTQLGYKCQVKTTAE